MGLGHHGECPHPMLDRVKELAAGFAAMGPKAQTASLGLGALAIAGPPLIAALGYMIQGIGSFGKALFRSDTADYVAGRDRCSRRRNACGGPCPLDT